MITPQIFAAFPWAFAATIPAKTEMTTPSAGDKHLHLFHDHLREQFSIPQHAHIAWMHEKHTTHIEAIHHISGSIQKHEATDGLITADTNTWLFVYTADCVPLFFLEPKSKTIALIHAGRKGIENGIHLLALQQLKTLNTTPSEEILVYLGPSIHSCCYPVDLQKIIVDDLKKNGVTNIETSDICTCCNPLHLASHHRGGSLHHNNWNVFARCERP